MIKDRILNQIFKQLQYEAKQNFGVELTEDEVAKIVDSQAVAIREGMEAREIIKVDYFGKFLIKPGREEAYNNSRKEAGHDYREINETGQETSSGE